MKYDFEDLNVYQDALDLAEEIYKATRDFPKEELYGMSSQIRRASISVALNIAEGALLHKSLCPVPLSGQRVSL